MINSGGSLLSYTSLAFSFDISESYIGCIHLRVSPAWTLCSINVPPFDALGHTDASLETIYLYSEL